MSERCALLHNMSAPPKSVMTYEGLSGLVQQVGPGGAGVASLTVAPVRIGGQPVRFELPEGFPRQSPRAILARLGRASGRGAEATLLALIEARARELPLPDACVVLPPRPIDPVLWTDLLTTLAVLSKCSSAVWLRDKQPSIATGIARQRVSLLVPPSCVDRLPRGDAS